MAQETTPALLGLHTDPSELVRPRGSAATADNVDFERPGVAEVRRGFTVAGADGGKTFSPDTLRAVQIFDLSPDGNPVDIAGHWDTDEFFQTNQLTGGFQGTGLIKAKPDGAAKVRFLRTNAGVYVTAVDGVYRWATQERAGLLPPSFTLMIPSSPGGDTVLPASRALAYRAVNIRKFADGRIQISPPSGRYVLTSADTPSAGHELIGVGVQLAADAKAGDVIALYRSRDPILADASALALPTDEMFFIASKVLTSSDIASGNVAFNDDFPSEEVPALESNGAPLLLYTSATADGIAEANDVPPVCSDIELFQNHVFFAQPKREFLSFFANPLNNTDDGSNNFTAADTVTIIGTSTVVLTCSDTPQISMQNYASSAAIVATWGAVSASESMSEALVSYLVAAINAFSDTHGVYAVAAERASSLTANKRTNAYFPAEPKRRIVLRSLTDQPFGVAFSSSVTGANAPFADEAGDLDGRTINSETDEIPNGLAFSKPDQPEAVPLLRSLRVGSDAPITRIRRLRNSLLIFKRDGWFRLTGTDITNFRVQELDPTLDLLAPESLAELDNELYGLFDQGIMALSESSKRRVSGAIDFTVREALSASTFADRQTLFDLTIGGAFEEDQKYFLGFPSDASTFPSELFVYSRRANAWSKYQKPSTCIAISSIKRLLLGARDEPWIWQQRRSFSIDDFSEQSETVVVDVVNSQTSLDIRFAGVAVPRAFEPSVGDAINAIDAFGNTAWGIVQAVQTLSAPTEYRVTVTPPVGTSSLGYTTGVATLYQHIHTRLELSPLYGNANLVAIGKQYDLVSWLFAALRVQSGLAGFATDLSSDEEQLTINDQWRGAWGFQPWIEPFNGTARPGKVLTHVPRNKARASELTLSWECKCAQAQWRLQGVTVTFDPETEVIKR